VKVPKTTSSEQPVFWSMLQQDKVYQWSISYLLCHFFFIYKLLSNLVYNLQSNFLNSVIVTLEENLVFEVLGLMSKLSSGFYYVAFLYVFIPENGDEVSEEIRTEIRFLYQDCPPEVTTNHPKLHVGISRSLSMCMCVICMVSVVCMCTQHSINTRRN